MRTPTRVHPGIWLLALVSLLGSIACSGPRDATPLPEPPALDPGRISTPGEISFVSTALTLNGSNGAAPANATVRVTNLDSMAGPFATTANGEGAFTLNVPEVVLGNELRFQALVGSERSAPVDFVYSAGTPNALTPSPRHTCVTLSPGFELSFDAPGTRGFTLLNACPTALGVSNPRSRLGLTTFALVTPLPLEVATSLDATLDVEFTGTAGSGEEDTLFLELTQAGGVLRYPVTLIAP